MLTHTFVKAIVLSSAMLLSTVGASTAATAVEDCPTRVQELKAALANSVVADRSERAIAKQYLAIGSSLHEQGKHTQAHQYLDFAVGKVAR
ncbi:MAG TPA: hypothetical protein VGE72_10105 [Azospirillum sp.]